MDIEDIGEGKTIEISRGIDLEIIERINKLEKEIHNIKNVLGNINTKNTGSSDVDLGELKERVSKIENHIYRRNPFMAKRQQKKDS